MDRTHNRGNRRADEPVGSSFCHASPVLTWREAEVKCYGEYETGPLNPGGDDISTAAFVWQHAIINIPGRQDTSYPPVDGYLDNVVEGPYLIAKVFRRDASNPVGEWKQLGDLFAYVLDDNGNPTTNEIPIGEDVNIAFGPYYNLYETPLSYDAWEGIPCRRPYEELIFGICWEQSLYGWAEDEEGRLVIFNGNPCQGWSQSWYPMGWDEPYNVIENRSSRNTDVRRLTTDSKGYPPPTAVQYGEPHTWADVNGNLILNDRKPTYAPLCGDGMGPDETCWEDRSDFTGFGLAPYHPLNNNAKYPFPPLYGCSNPCREDLFYCQSGGEDDINYGPGMFNALYKFGPIYESLQDFLNPFPDIVDSGSCDIQLPLGFGRSSRDKSIENPTLNSPPSVPKPGTIKKPRRSKGHGNGRPGRNSKEANRQYLWEKQSGKEL